MEICSPGLQAGIFLFFRSIGKLYPPVCSTLPTKLQAQGRRPGIAIRSKVEQKGRVIYVTSFSSISCLSEHWSQKTN